MGGSDGEGNTLERMGGGWLGGWVKRVSFSLCRSRFSLSNPEWRGEMSAGHGCGGFKRSGGWKGWDAEGGSVCWIARPPARVVVVVWGGFSVVVGRWGLLLVGGIAAVDGKLKREGRHGFIDSSNFFRSVGAEIHGC